VSENQGLTGRGQRGPAEQIAGETARQPKIVQFEQISEGQEDRMARVNHEGDVKVEAEQVTVTKSTHITGSLEIKGNVLVKGELVITGPLVITGKVTIAAGGQVDVDGPIVHNGEIETPED